MYNYKKCYLSSLFGVEEYRLTEQKNVKKSKKSFAKGKTLAKKNSVKTKNNNVSAKNNNAGTKKIKGKK